MTVNQLPSSKDQGNLDIKKLEVLEGKTRREWNVVNWRLSHAPMSWSQRSIKVTKEVSKWLRIPTTSTECHWTIKSSSKTSFAPCLSSTVSQNNSLALEDVMWKSERKHCQPSPVEEKGKEKVLIESEFNDSNAYGLFYY